MPKKSTKSSLELRRRVKKAEADKREEMLKSMPVTVVTAEDNNKISFEQWWMLINKKVKLKTWLKEILLVDFQSRGLSKSESENKYNDALRLFGIKF